MLWIIAMLIGAVVPHWINSARDKIRNFAGARASLKLTPLDQMRGPWCGRAHRAADALTGGSNKNRDELLRRGTEIKLWGNIWDSSVIIQKLSTALCLLQGHGAAPESRTSIKRVGFDLVTVWKVQWSATPKCEGLFYFILLYFSTYKCIFNCFCFQAQCCFWRWLRLLIVDLHFKWHTYY